MRFSVRDLRRIGGTWRAIQVNFGTYWYEGEMVGSKWRVQSAAHMAPRYDGDDDTFVVRWHIYRDDKPVGYPTDDPTHFLLFYKEKSDEDNR